MSDEKHISVKLKYAVTYRISALCPLVHREPNDKLANFIAISVGLGKQH